MGEFNTFGHGAEGTNYSETFSTVEELNEALRELDFFHNLPYSWRYYQEEGLVVEIFMPRKGKTTSFKVPDASADDAQKLNRERLRKMITEHTREEVQ